MCVFFLIHIFKFISLHAIKFQRTAGRSRHAFQSFITSKKYLKYSHRSELRKHNKYTVKKTYNIKFLLDQIWKVAVIKSCTADEWNRTGSHSMCFTGVCVFPCIFVSTLMEHSICNICSFDRIFACVQIEWAYLTPQLSCHMNWI